MVSFHLSTSVILSVVLAVILASEDDEKSIPFEDQQPYCAAMSAPKEQKFANCSRPEVASDCPCTCKKSCRTARKAIADERIVDCCAVNNIDPKCKHLCHYTADPAQVRTEAMGCWTGVKTWLYCAAQGKDSNDCCKALGLSSVCHSFCQGTLPSLKVIIPKATEYLKCLDRINDILSCQRESIPKEKGYEANHKFPAE